MTAGSTALAAGLTGNIRLMAWVGTFIGAIIAAAFVYVVCGCWKRKLPEGYSYQKSEDLPKFNKAQIISMLSLPVFIITFIITGWQVGMLVCIFTFLLILLKAVDQKTVFARTQWGSIVLDIGTGVYMAVCNSLLYSYRHKQLQAEAFHGVDAVKSGALQTAPPICGTMPYRHADETTPPIITASIDLIAA